MELKYTLIFLKCEDEILLINREKPSWMGRWNGLGGHIEPHESPEESAKRELWEEAGVWVNEIKCLAHVGWIVNDNPDTLGGMYCFWAEIPKELKKPTPVKTMEGILDWKTIDWIMDEKNSGIAGNIPYFFPNMLKGEFKNYLCKYGHDFDYLGEIKEDPLNY